MKSADQNDGSNIKTLTIYRALGGEQWMLVARWGEGLKWGTTVTTH